MPFARSVVCETHNRPTRREEGDKRHKLYIKVAFLKSEGHGIDF